MVRVTHAAPSAALPHKNPGAPAGGAGCLDGVSSSSSWVVRELMVAKLIRGALLRFGIGAGAAVLLTMAGTAYAGIDSWTPASTDGGLIQTIAIDPATPSTLYVGTAGSGVFKSQDGGATWQAARNGIENADVQALAIDPVDTDNIYAGTATSGIYRSRDGGVSWAAINGGLKNLNVYTIAVHPQDPARVYAGTFGNLFQTVNADSTNADEVVWSTVGVPTSPQQTNLLNNTVYAVTLDPANPDTLFVGTHSGGVFRRLGGAWAQVWQDPRANPSTTISNVRAVTVSNDGTTVFAATQGLGIYTSITSGNTGTWSATAGTGLTTSVLRSLAMVPANPTQQLYAGTAEGFFYSINGGTTWTESTTELNTLAIAIDPATPTTVYTGTSQGLFKSTDGGATFVPAQAGITNYSVVALVSHPSEPSLKYAATRDSGVLRSTDGGVSWSTFNDGLTSLQTTALALDTNSSPATLYAGTGDGIFHFPALNGTETWERLTNNLATRRIEALVADPTVGGTVYAGTATAGVLATGNGGLSWLAINEGIANERSDACLLSPEDACFYENLEVDALGIDPSNPSVLYVGLSSRGVLKSSDAGATWTSRSNGLTNTFVTAIAVDPSNGDLVYLGTQAGVFRSTDGGAVWEAASSGVGPVEITALVVDPDSRTTLYAGTANAGVYKSTDQGNSWTAINTDLESLAVRALSLDASTTPPTLFAGVKDHGIWTIQSTVSGGASGPGTRAATGAGASTGNESGGGVLGWWNVLILAASMAGHRQRRKAQALRTAAH